jgi:cytochrome bd-type quinol oxidase subunit 2
LGPVRAEEQLDSFSYLSVLLSIVIGLAITQVLQGLRVLMLSRETARLYAPSLIWAALVLLIATQMWWSSFGLRDQQEWTFALYSLILLQVALFYLASGLVLPDLRPNNIDLEADYFRNRRWFFGLLAGAAVVSVLKDLALEGRLPDTPNLLFHIVLIGSCIGAIVNRNRRYHAILAPISLLLFLGYIALLFARL